MPGGGNEAVQVVVRCRPMNSKEKNEDRKPIVSMDLDMSQVALKNPSKEGDHFKNFTFDAVYDETTTQRYFYEGSCFGLVDSILEGFLSSFIKKR